VNFPALKLIATCNTGHLKSNCLNVIGIGRNIEFVTNM
jgi:hypothetical protein